MGAPEGGHPPDEENDDRSNDRQGSGGVVSFVIKEYHRKVMTNAIKNRGRPPDLRDQIAAHLRARAALQGRITPTTTSRIASEVGASRDYTGKVLRSWPAWFVRVGYKRSRHVYWKPSPALVLEALPDDEDATNT